MDMNLAFTLLVLGPALKLPKSNLELSRMGWFYTQLKVILEWQHEFEIFLIVFKIYFFASHPLVGFTQILSTKSFGTGDI